MGTRLLTYFIVVSSLTFSSPIEEKEKRKKNVVEISNLIVLLNQSALVWKERKKVGVGGGQDGRGRVNYSVLPTP